MTDAREHWKTKVGLVLAMAGNAVGLGNFLRFPVQAAQNGGGAFLIPYLIALVFLAVPLMWCEWAMGRMGGEKGHGTTPGIFAMLWRNPLAKYLGVLGVFLPLGVCIYYVYIESWTLAYSIFSLTGTYKDMADMTNMRGFLSSFQGIQPTPSGLGTAYFFFTATMAVNAYILYRGITGGIEKLARWAMPLLFIFAVLLLIRVFTLGTPDPSQPENNVFNGLGFIWNPDFSQLGNASVWLAAAGQIFFTTSVGFGAIQCYASYLKKKDDIVVGGLSTVMTNETAEIVLGGSIAIPISFAFFGGVLTREIAQQGAFDLGFVAMPIAFQKIPLGAFLGGMWFFLLFIAAITSSVALLQPMITFLQDDLGLTRRKAVTSTIGLCFLAAHIPIFGLKAGALDEMDFWIGTFGVALLATIEAVLFIWVFGPNKAWEEIHAGAKFRVPRFFLWVLKYVTPVYLLALFIAWTYQGGWDTLMMTNVPPESVPWRWAARVLMLAIFFLLCLMARRSRRIRQLEQHRPA
jgi:neurotransmitter:Na+ symporter, NSS family